jgi:carboxypeptidase C (cathepsin A)
MIKMTAESKKLEEGDTQKELIKEEPPKDKIVETKHSIVLNRETIAYTVTCGTIVLKVEEEKKGEKEGEAEGEKPKATIFFTAYTRDDVGDKTTRPLTFSFNGGPGSSSVWLHLGLLGPRRLLMDEMGNPLPPPGKLVDNEFSLLGQTDLVFIDPVSTGYSRAVPGEKPRQFHGFKKDIESVGDFIRLYTSRYQRWASPKFLIGESYGTTRAAGLSGYLQDRHGMYLNGIMLISAILNFQTARFGPGNDLPYILFLPTYASTAWYHQRLEPDLQVDLQATLRQVEAFAQGEYCLALMKGSSLPVEERTQIIKKLERFTGLTADYIDRTNLRIEIFRFTKELLRHEHRTVGRLDSRFKGIDRDSAGEKFDYDPSMANITGPYTAAFNDYVRSELNFESDLPYEILTNRVAPWSYAEFENNYVNVAETLRQSMAVNPCLKVYVANGYYDFATPYFATEYTFNHLGLDESLRGNLRMGYFEAGHMMYIHIPSLARLRADLEAFIGWAK